ncbi:DUF192 domain-containing protein [Patescibacteria group bacterium]|nr:DUF192 domain-containing protein [Patescibacteria group bacterium]
MQGKNKFAFYVIMIMVVAALGLKAVNFFTKKGEVLINQKVFKVEVLKKEWELKKGLSGRSSLAESKGLLFAFPNPDKYGFWMKGMKFPIDIIWIDDGKIVDIKQSAPVPLTQNYETYTPAAPARYVLEINAGLSEEYGLKVGDSVALDI